MTMNRHHARPACWLDAVPPPGAYGPRGKQPDGSYRDWPGDARWCGNATADYWPRHIDLTPGCIGCGRGYEARVEAGDSA